MKKKTFIFDSIKIGLNKIIHFDGKNDINFSKESTKIIAYSNNSTNPYFIDFVEKYIRQINQYKTTYFDIPIPTNCNHIKIELFGLTDYDLNKIEVSAIS